MQTWRCDTGVLPPESVLLVTWLSLTRVVMIYTYYKKACDANFKYRHTVLKTFPSPVFQWKKDLNFLLLYNQKMFLYVLEGMVSCYAPLVNKCKSHLSSCLLLNLIDFQNLPHSPDKMKFTTSCNFL